MRDVTPEYCANLVYVFNQAEEAAAWDSLIAAAPNPDSDPRRNSEPPEGQPLYA
jgi:hypothetical protein